MTKYWRNNLSIWSHWRYSKIFNLQRGSNSALRLVQTTAILLQPATNAVCCRKNRKFSNQLQCTAIVNGHIRIVVSVNTNPNFAKKALKWCSIRPFWPFPNYVWKTINEWSAHRLQTSIVSLKLGADVVSFWVVAVDDVSYRWISLSSSCVAFSMLLWRFCNKSMTFVNLSDGESWHHSYAFEC